MNDPIVSIGMPVYNGEDLLSETLDSILAQTFANFEVVISDNASTDATPQICRAYSRRDQRIRYERADLGISIPNNFKRAFHLSHGQYFKWHAHDDLLHPEFLSHCVTILNGDPTTLVVGTRYGLIETDGSAVPFDAKLGKFVTSYGEKISVPGRAGTDALASGDRLTRFRSMLFDVRGADEGKYIFGLIRSEALAATRLNEGYIGGDKVLLARLSLVGRFTEVTDELFFRRYHPGHVAGAEGDTWLGHIRLAKKLEPDRPLTPFPLARQVSGYLRAISDANITRAEKVRCVAMVVEKIANVGMERVQQLSARIRAAVARR